MHFRRNVAHLAAVLAIQFADQKLGDGAISSPCARAAAAGGCGTRSGGSTDPRASGRRARPPREPCWWPPPRARPPRIRVLPPRRRTLESSRMRSSLACVSAGISPISSSSSVPSCATSKQPARRSEAPVNEPFLMAEQLALDQRFRQRRAVDGEERPLPPRAERVQRARHQLFSGAAFARDQHAGVGRSGLLQQHEDLLHARRTSPPSRRAIPCSAVAARGCGWWCAGCCASRRAAAALAARSTAPAFRETRMRPARAPCARRFRYCRTPSARWTAARRPISCSFSRNW